MDAAGALLAVSSADGCIRMWRDHDYGNEQMASAWNTNAPSVDGPLLQFVGDESAVYTENNDTALCWWDVKKEQLASRRSFADTHQPIRSLCCLRDEITTESVVLGFDDGRIALVDERVRDLIKLSSDNQTGSISKIAVVDKNSLLASTPGLLHLVDLRRGDKRWQKRIEHDHLAAHPQLPLFAVSKPADHSLSFYTIAADQPGELHCNNTVRYHEGLLGRRLAATMAMFSHNKRPVFAVGGSDSTVSLYL